MNRVGVEEGQAIENSLISRAIENAQHRVEEHNFSIRKQLLEFDDVMNQQREVIYTQRREIMTLQDVEPMIQGFVHDLVEDIMAPVEEAGKDGPDQEAIQGVKVRLDEVFALRRVMDLEQALPSQEEAKERVQEILDALKANAGEHYQEILRFFLLESLDRFWKEHLLNMDYLKEGIGLRGYGQKNPKQEYKKEGFELFQELLYLIKENTLKSLCRVRLQEAPEQELQHQEEPDKLQFSGGDETAASTNPEPFRRESPKVGRNDPCPCGSGKKYKKCCGR
jgi:preprotein translocase subunit SecA